MDSKDTYIAELERQDVALRERIEQLYREKERLERGIENTKTMLLGAYERGVFCPYIVQLAIQTQKQGVYNTLNFSFASRMDIANFFMPQDSHGYNLARCDRNVHIIKIKRPGIRRLDGSYYDSYISLYATPKLPPMDGKPDYVTQIFLIRGGRRISYYSFPEKEIDEKRKSMDELITMVTDYIYERNEK